MEYAKDEIFSIQYNDARNTLEFNQNGTSRLVRFFRKNCLIKVITLLTIVFSTLNVLFIYHFFRVLTTL